MTDSTMQAKLTLVPFIGETITREFDWDATLKVINEQGNHQDVQVKHLSVFLHRPLIDGVEYGIAHMLSKPTPKLEETCYG